MSMVDLKVGAVVGGTIALFTLIANVIPQVQSEVPEDVSFGANVTAEELVAAGEQLFHGAGGCLACHAESAGARAPNLSTDYQGEGTIGTRCGARVPGLSCKEYLHQALVRPMDHVVGDYPPIMPPVDRSLSPPQVWALVAYLETMGGEVTVSASDIPADTGPVGAGAAPAPGIAATDGEGIAREICVMCHLLGEEGTALGPPLDGVGTRRTAEEIRRAILDPTAVVAEGYEDLAGVMPPNFGTMLTASQLEELVRYLSGLR